MNVYVISLSNSKDRRERIKKQLDKLGIEFDFFEAANGNERNFLYSERANPNLTVRRKGYALKPGEIACFSSHYTLWEKCCELGEPILILEDNVDIKPEITEVIEILADESNHYNYIKLAATFPSKFNTIKTLTPNLSLGQYIKKSCGTTAYVLSPKAAKYFIENADQFIEPVDDYLEKPWRHGIKTYSVYPSLFERAEISSTINSNSTRRKEKKSTSLLSKLIIELYRIYESIMRYFYWNH